MNDLKSVLEASARRDLVTLVKEINPKNVGNKKQDDSFKRHKQHSSSEEMKPTRGGKRKKKRKKKTAPEMHTGPPSRKQSPVTTNNFYTPLCTTEMETDTEEHCWK